LPSHSVSVPLDSGGSAPGNSSADAPPPGGHHPRGLAGAPLALRALALGAAYGALSTTVTVVTSFGTEIGALFRPGAGLTLAVLLLCPRREWPILLAAVFVAEVVVDLANGSGEREAFFFAVANCVEPLVAALVLLRHGRGRPDLGRLPDLARFAAAGVLLGPAVGALLATALPALFLGDPWLPRLPRWVVGDGLGVLLVAPYLLTRRTARDIPRRHRWELLTLLTLLTAVAAGPWDDPARTGLEYALIPALVVVAIRLRSRGAAAGVVIVAALLEGFSAAGLGPFAEGGAGGGFAAGQTFLAMTALTALTVAAFTDDLVARERRDAELRVAALHDPLTGAGNRHLLEERLGHALDRLRRHPGNGIAVLSVDLDDFKGLNDRYGHSAGDAVLVEVARRITDAVRTSDTVARCGGDQFVVVAEDFIDERAARAMVLRLRAEISRPVAWNGIELTLGGSVGLAVGTGDVTADALLADADRSMYAAKAARRSNRRLPRQAGARQFDRST
jgi:diguanylate cyclase (GGDEF)-like protein